jgi:hypothetical protein
MEREKGKVEDCKSVAPPGWRAEAQQEEMEEGEKQPWRECESALIMTANASDNYGRRLFDSLYHATL